jgi:cytochrome c-type biogenesis protein CcmE
MNINDTNTVQTSGSGNVPLLKRKRVIFAGAIVLMAMGFLIYIGLSHFATYYYTVSEFAAQSESLSGEQVRVTGQIIPDSVIHDTDNFTLNFTITDGETSLPVVYQGVVPDTFKAGTDIVVEGRSDQQGVFNASVLITKCPSKYEPSG